MEVAVTPVEILLVEDNPGDVRLMKEAFEKCSSRKNIHVVTDGVEALDYVKGRGMFGAAPRPDLIILDLNLPKKDGREVLREIKTDPDLKNIPVLVFTTSAAEDDVDRCYALSANCYISKPIDLFHYFAVVKSIDEFWMTVVRLPKRA